MGHGSRLYRNNQVSYTPNELKIIRRIWSEVLREEFRPDPRGPLDDLVQGRLGKRNYEETLRTVKTEFAAIPVFYSTRSRHAVEIPPGLRPLMALCLAAERGRYRRNHEPECIYMGK